MKKNKLNIKKLIGILFAVVLITALFLRISLNPSKIFPNAKITSDKKVYKAYEIPTFKLKLNEKQKASVIKSVFADEEPSVKAEFINSSDKKTTIVAFVSKEDAQTYSISPSQTNSFKPGKYTLSTTIESQTGTRNLTQDFTWGVLALNPNKAVYYPKETAKIAIGVLDDKGEMVCNADVTLSVTKPDGTKIEKRTSNNSIKVTNQCHSKEESIVPDYETQIKLLDEGTYILDLIAITKNGIHQIRDNIKVSTSIDFDIERSSATRLYPKNQYPMTINITANKDYSGTVSETVPSDFAIIKSKQDNRITDYAAKITEENGFRLINWQVDWKKGEKHTLSYVYKAPNRSPDFFLIGNLKFENGFTEGRMWQLANDATVTTITTSYTDPCGANCYTIPADWGSPFSIEVIGPGGNGATSVSVPGGGGGGGAYSKVTTGTYTPGNSYSFQLGTGGSGTATWFNTSGTVNAGAGGNATGRTHGNGGTVGAGTGASGGNGGDGGNLAGAGGGGGGGAAGPNGAGGVGGSGTATGATGGGGGGGNGAASGNTGSSATGTNGANGGNGNGGTGGGVGGAGTGGNATAGTGGGGAGGAGTTAAGGAFAGGTGAAGSDISGASTGTGGGGGGGGGNTRTTSTGNNGGNGSTPTANTGAGGGGGGDCTDAGCTEGAGQTGSNGFIVVTYTPASINVSGNVYSTGTTPSTDCDASGATNEVSLRSNGTTYSASCSNTDGSFTFTSVSAPSAGGGMIIWLTGTTKGAIAIRYDGSGDSTSNIFYDNIITVTSDDTNGVTNAVMDTWDNGNDTNIPYTVTTNALTTNSGYAFLVNLKSGVASGSTVYAPGGTITTNTTGGDVTVGTNAVATIDTATSAVGGNITINSGATLNINADTTVSGGSITTTGTLSTTSGTPTVTIRGTGSISGAGTKTIYNLTVGDATVATTTLSNSLSVSNNASVGTGSTFNINADLTVAGSLTNTTTGIINQTANSPIVTVSGTSIGGGSGNITFYRLQKAGAGTTTFSGSGTNTINNTLDATAGTLTLSNDITVTGNTSASTGATLNQNANLIVNGGSFLTSGTGVVNTTAGTGTVTISGTGNIGGGGTVTIYALAINGNQTAQSTITANNSINVGSSGTFTLTGQNINSGGSFTNTTTGVIACSGTSGNVTMTAGGTLGSGNGNITFCNLATSTTGTTTFSGGGTNTVNNNVSVAAGTTLNLNSSIAITGNLTNATSGVIGTTAGTPTITVSGTTIGGGTTGAITFYALTKAGAGTTTFSNGGTNTINNDLSVSNGTFTQSSTLTVTGNGSVSTGATYNINADLIINGGSLTTTGTGIINTTSGTPTVTVSGAGSVGGGSGNITFYNLTKSAAGTITFSGSSTNTINNTLAISAGTLTIANNLTIGSSSVTNSGGISASGTLNYSGTPTVTIQSSSLGAATIGGAGSLTFYNLSFLPTVASAPTFTLGSAASQTITIDNDLTIGNGTNSVIVTTNTNNPIIDINGSLIIATSGTFTAPPSATFTIAKNMTNNGTFNNNAGTVTFDTANSSTFDGSGTPAIQFNNFTSTTANKTLIFTASKTFRIDGLFTVSGTASNIQSTSGTQWLVNLQGTSSITNTTITNSGCSGSLDINLNATNTDGTNNGTCWVFTAGSTIINSGIKGNTRIQGNVRFK